MRRKTLLFVGCIVAIGCKQQLGPGDVPIDFGIHHLQVTVPVRLLEINPVRGRYPFFEGVSLGTREFNFMHVTTNQGAPIFPQASYQTQAIPGGKLHQHVSTNASDGSPSYDLWIERTLGHHTYQCECDGLSETTLAMVTQICLSLRTRS